VGFVVFFHHEAHETHEDDSEPLPHQKMKKDRPGSKSHQQAVTSPAYFRSESQVSIFHSIANLHAAIVVRFAVEQLQIQLPADLRKESDARTE
jgi:hypothetical protein